MINNPLPTDAMNLIRSARGLSGLSQGKLAEKVRVSVTSLAKIETGTRVPSLKLFGEIMGALDYRVGFSYWEPNDD